MTQSLRPWRFFQLQYVASLIPICLHATAIG
jgi:hypothetical protein